MPYCWLRLFCLLSLFGVTLVSHAQETTSYNRPQTPIPDPVYVLNSTIIINGVLADFTAKETKEIKKIRVYKGMDTPDAQDIPPQLKHLGAGVLDITSSKRVRSRSFAQLGRRLGLRGPLTFALNGHPLDAQAVDVLRIAPAAIGQLHIVRPTPEVSTTRVDIWLVLPPKTDHSQYPQAPFFFGKLGNARLFTCWERAR